SAAGQITRWHVVARDPSPLNSPAQRGLGAFGRLERGLAVLAARDDEIADIWGTQVCTKRLVEPLGRWGERGQIGKVVVPQTVMPPCHDGERSGQQCRHRPATATHGSDGALRVEREGISLPGGPSGRRKRRQYPAGYQSCRPDAGDRQQSELGELLKA